MLKKKKLLICMAVIVLTSILIYGFLSSKNDKYGLGHHLNYWDMKRYEYIIADMWESGEEVSFTGDTLNDIGVLYNITDHHKMSMGHYAEEQEEIDEEFLQEFISMTFRYIDNKDRMMKELHETYETKGEISDEEFNEIVEKYMKNQEQIILDEL